MSVFRPSRTARTRDIDAKVAHKQIVTSSIKSFSNLEHFKQLFDNFFGILDLLLREAASLDDFIVKLPFSHTVDRLSFDFAFNFITSMSVLVAFSHIVPSFF